MRLFVRFLAKLCAPSSSELLTSLSRSGRNASSNIIVKRMTDTEEKCDVEGGNLMEKIVKAMECHEDLQCFSSYSLLGRTRQL